MARARGHGSAQLHEEAHFERWARAHGKIAGNGEDDVGSRHAVEDRRRDEPVILWVVDHAHGESSTPETRRCSAS